jgi:hypothetical protein
VGGWASAAVGRVGVFSPCIRSLEPAAGGQLVGGALASIRASVERHNRSNGCLWHDMLERRQCAGLY